MSNYFTCTKMLLKYKLKMDKTKKNGGRIAIGIILGITYLMLAFLGVMMVYGLATTFNQLGLQNEFLTLLLLVGMVFVLIFGIISMLSYLYFSSDTEFFMALPVSAGTVYMSKLTIVYLIELITSTLLLLPCLITAGVIFNMGAIYYITMFFAILLTPAIPLFVASVLSIPLMYVVSFFKKRAALSSIAVVLLFGLIFGAYYAVIVNMSKGMDTSDYEQSIIAMSASIQAVANAFYPILSFVRFATMTPAFGLGVTLSMLINIVIYAGTIAALLGLAYLISSTVYRKGATSQLEGTSTLHTKGGEFAQSSQLKALMKKEWKEVIRTPAFAFQCLSGVILAPIIIVFMTALNNGNFAMLPPEQMPQIKQMMFFIGLGIALMMGVSMNMGACTIMSREGDKAYYSKMIPVDYKTQVRAKTYVFLIISSVTIFVSVIALIISNISFDYAILFGLLGFGYLLIYNYGFVCFAAYFDLNKPKLDWTTPNEAMKHNMNSQIPVFINMGISTVFIILPIVFSMLLYSLASTIIMWVMFYIIAISVAVVMHFLLYKNADRLMSKIIK